MFWLLLAILLVWAGTFPDDYLIHVRGILEPQPYPLIVVLIELLFSAIVFWMFWWALKVHSWKRIVRSFVLAIVACATATLAALGSMHAQTHFMYFACAMLTLALCSLLLTLLWLSLGIFHRYREQYDR